MKLRRVVTGFDAKGKAIVSSDGVVQDREIPGGSKIAPFWGYVDKVSVDAPDRLANGYDGSFDTDAAALNWGVIELGPDQVLPMHSTKTVDLITVLQGEVTCVLDSGDVITLKVHDVLLQRGVSHQWENRGKIPCVWTFATLGRLGK